MVDIPRIQRFSPSGQFQAPRENISVRNIASRSFREVAGAEQAIAQNFGEQAVRQVADAAASLNNLTETVRQEREREAARQRALGTALINDRIARANADIARHEIEIKTQPGVEPLQRRKVFERVVSQSISEYEKDLPEQFKATLRSRVTTKSLIVAARLDREGFKEHVENRKAATDVTEQRYQDEFLRARSPEEKALAISGFTEFLDGEAQAGVFSVDEVRNRVRKFGEGLANQEAEIAAVAQPTRMLIHLEKLASGQAGDPELPQNFSPTKINELRAKASTALQQSVSAANALRAEEERAVKASQKAYLGELLVKINQGIDISAELNANAHRLGEDDFKVASDSNYNRKRDAVHDAQRAADRAIAAQNAAETKALRREAAAERRANQTNFQHLADLYRKLNQGELSEDIGAATQEIDRAQLSRQDKEQVLVGIYSKQKEERNTQAEAARKLIRAHTTAVSKFNLFGNGESDVPAKIEAEFEAGLSRAIKEGRTVWDHAASVLSRNTPLYLDAIRKRNPQVEKDALAYTTGKAITEAQIAGRLSKEEAAYHFLRLESTNITERIRQEAEANAPKVQAPSTGSLKPSRQRRLGE